MKTEVRRIDPEAIDLREIRAAGETVRFGGLCAFPTETVYGLGGDALNPESSKKIYEAKGRPSDNPLIVHIADLDRLPAIAEEIPEDAVKLAEAFWPGPLTMIFRKTELVPYETSGGLDTVAVRMPSDPVAAAFIREAGGYVAAPSANRSGRPSPTNAADVIEDMDGRIDCILDGGASMIGLESTIVDLTESVPAVLRPGFINLEMLRSVVPEMIVDPGILEDAEKKKIRPKAPGMRYRHYAPKAPLIIVEGSREQVIREIDRLCAEAERDGKHAAVLTSEENRSCYASSRVCAIGSRDAEASIAHNLFTVLRQFDREDVDVIYSESFDTPALGMAIMNRLLKAAGHQVHNAGRVREDGCL